MAKIYLVDDDAAVRSVLLRALERLGHEVHPFESGTQALEEAERDPPDAVFSDIYMPNGDGIELLLALAALEPRIPVIAMSGGGCFPSALVLEDASRLGAVAALEKPIALDGLRTALEAALSGDAE